MESAARLALEDLARQAVCSDLDRISVELAELRQTVRLLERATGLTASRLAVDERREYVAQLRERGLSERVIGRVVGAHRQTIARDARALGLPPPAASLGVDGIARRPPGRA